MYVVGESGCGKSEFLKLLCIRFGQQWRKGQKRSLVLIDPHGDLAQEVARLRMFHKDEKGPRIAYIDPTLKNGRVPSLNPFDFTPLSSSSYQQETYAQMLAQVFTSMLKNGESELSLQMETLLIPCLCVLLEKKGSTLLDLIHMMQAEPSHDLIETGMRSSNPSHAHFFKHSFFHELYRATRHAIATRCQSLLNQKLFTDMTCGIERGWDVSESLQR